MPKKILAASAVIAALIFVAIPMPVLSGAKTGLRVEGIRYWSGPNYTRVVVDLNAKPGEYTDHLLKEDETINKPRRLFVDIKNSTLAKGVEKSIPINNALLKVVRAGQFSADTARIVLDIESIDSYKVFVLPNPYRIVIDITGTGSKFSQAAREKAKAAPTVTTPVTAPSVPAAAIETPKPPVTTAAPKPEPVTTTPVIKPSSTQQARLIVIDAGHGGKDPGAVGKKKTREKDITLKIARLIKDKIKNGTNHKVVLTRDKDVFIPLDERTAIANTKEADIFVSIHVNASFNRKAKGVETYFLKLEGLNKEELLIAARENQTSEAEMSDTLKYILGDLTVTANRDESIRLASVVQENLSKNLAAKYNDVKSNGIKGAPFYVLVHTTMPSILVEVSFISNQVEEQRLKSDAYLSLIADSIYDAVVKYLDTAS